jgi:calcium channel MID1
VLNELPFFGDTTSNQALLFSPPFAKPFVQVPTYPNYTLPVASLAFTDTPPSSPPNYTLVLSPTPSSSLTSGPQTGCFLSSQNITGTIANQSLWLRDEEGWRVQWLLEGLSPSTNYTAYAIQDGTKVAGPIYFATKSRTFPLSTPPLHPAHPHPPLASFPCPLVAFLPFCPAVSHAVPLPAPPSGTIYDSTNLPQTNLTSALLTYLTNFTVTLTTFACGRDHYSPLVECSDCQREYRKWLCAVSFSRCGEPSLGSPSAFTAFPATPTQTGLSALKSLMPPIPGIGGGPSQKQKQQQQVVLSALLPQTTPRNPSLPEMDYTLLLPCLETCTAVDRACPPFLLFQCPTRKFNAAASYGVGYVDGADGDEGEGVAGVAQDRWGNVWCHLG